MVPFDGGMWEYLFTPVVLAKALKIKIIVKNDGLIIKALY